MTIDREERKMSLSIKRLQEDPWKKVGDKYAVGSRHKGVVKNLTPYGVFVELDDFFGGMVHISELSWLKRYNHPSEFTKVGNEMDVMVLEVDADNRKLVLGHKQLEENPWTTLETVFPVGSVHEATVLEVDGKGAQVQLPYGLTAFCPKKHSALQTGGFITADQKLPFKVIEFNATEKRILVSHARIWEEEVRETVETEKATKKAEGERTRKAMKDIQNKQEKSTLGDLGVLSELKSKMDGESAAAEEKAPE